MWSILKVLRYLSFTVLQDCIENRNTVSWENIKVIIPHQNKKKTSAEDARKIVISPECHQHSGFEHPSEAYLAEKPDRMRVWTSFLTADFCSPHSIALQPPTSNSFCKIQYISTKLIIFLIRKDFQCSFSPISKYIFGPLYFVEDR